MSKPILSCLIDKEGWAFERRANGLVKAVGDTYRVVKGKTPHPDADVILVSCWYCLGDLEAQGLLPRTVLGIVSFREVKEALDRPDVLSAMKRCAALFSPNERLRQYAQGAIGRPIHLLGADIDTDLFKQASGSIGTSMGPVIGFVGNARRWEKRFYFAQATQSITPGSILTGRGPGTGLTVKTEREMSEFYSSLDCTIMCSIEEGGPGCILESLACGTPVIASPVGIAPDVIVNGKNGFLCDNPTEFSVAAVRCMRRRNSMRQACRETAEAYDWAVHGPAWHSLLEEAKEKTWKRS